MSLNTTSPTTFTSAVLIGDTVNNDAPPTMTTVGNPAQPVSAALEIKSTSGGLLIPRMTTAQRLALTNLPTNGMLVYDVNIGSFMFLGGGVWTISPSGDVVEQHVAAVLTQSSVQGMFAAPVQILTPPGAGLINIVTRATLVNDFQTTAFAGGGPVILQYGNTVNGGGTNALSGTVAASFVNGGALQTINVYGSTTALAASATLNASLYLSNQTGAFTGGSGTSELIVDVWYTTIVTNV